MSKGQKTQVIQKANTHTFHLSFSSIFNYRLHPYYTNTASQMVDSKQVLKLYKQLLNKAYKFDNYNFREYSKRRVHDAFKEHKYLTDEEQINKFYNAGIDNLALLTRQTTISQLYTFDKLVVEPLKKHH